MPYPPLPTSPARIRLRRTIGQLQGIERMLTDRRNCEDIITQIMASRAALEKLCLELLADESSHCFVKNRPNRRKLKELERITRTMFRAA